MNYASKSIIVLVSEVLWAYYLIALFASVEYNEAIFVPAFWWLIAAVIGYLLNVLLAGRLHYVYLILGNLLFLGIIIVQNWKLAVPEGSWIFGVILSIAVSFVFIRSGSFVYQEPTRIQMLHRFEGSIIIYAILVLVFSINDWGNSLFHILFLFAILSSLLGMVLTLQGDEKSEGNKNVDVHKVGNPGWITGIISLLLVSVIAISALLFLPQVRNSLQVLAMNSMGGLKWIWSLVGKVILWISGLFTVSESDGTLPEMEAEEHVPIEKMPEDVMSVVSAGWFFVLLGVLVIIVFIWFISRFLKRWEPPIREKNKLLLKFKSSWWNRFKENIKVLLKRLRMSWMVRFSRYYLQPIYWYYYQVQKWGDKNGIPQLPTETTKEYIEKIITLLKEEESEGLILQLEKMQIDYQAAYYGGKSESGKYEEEGYRQLIKQLTEIEIKAKHSSINIK